MENKTSKSAGPDATDAEKTRAEALAEDPDVTETIDQLVALNEGRAAMYGALAHYYFKELTDDEIDFIAAQDFSAYGSADRLIGEGFEDMQHYLSKRNTGTRQNLAVDYAHTFLAAGNYTSFAATPYESVFT
ncbi:MAG: hypothetical protein LUB61_00725, partial [Eggerthellaceae bacterium]|nr:hypothetical protein [Eggerthellaceae bacterium]